MLTGLFLFSCSNEEITEPVVSNTATDMEILSRFVDVNESTGEYFINENKKTRALSYVTGSDWKDLAYIIHSGFISGYQNRYGDNLKPPTNVYHRMTA